MGSSLGRLNLNGSIEDQERRDSSPLTRSLHTAWLVGLDGNYLGTVEEAAFDIAGGVAGAADENTQSSRVGVIVPTSYH